MSRVKSYCCILVCTIMCCFCITTFCDVTNMLEVYPGKPPVPINLPYQYKHFTRGEIAQTQVLPERCFTILRHDSPKRFVLIGSLKPCIGIGLYYRPKNIAVLGHIHFSSNIHDFIAKAQEAFGVEVNPAEITGFLYTCRTANYEALQQGLIPFHHNWRECYQGRTQEQEIAALKGTIIRAFRIPNPTQINTTLRELSGYTDAQLGWYPLAEMYVVVYLSERGMEINNTCVFHEEMILRGYRAEFDKCYSEYVLYGGKGAIMGVTSTKCNIVSEKYFWDISIQDKNTYGMVRFKLFNDSEDFLEQREISHEELYQATRNSFEGRACAYCFKSGNVQSCAQCHKTFYCSAECQRAHWRVCHKERCKRIKESQ